MYPVVGIAVEAAVLVEANVVVVSGCPVVEAVGDCVDVGTEIDDVNGMVDELVDSPNVVVLLVYVTLAVVENVVVVTGVDDVVVGVFVVVAGVDDDVVIGILVCDVVVIVSDVDEVFVVAAAVVVAGADDDVVVGIFVVVVFVVVVSCVDDIGVVVTRVDDESVSFVD